MFQNAAFPENNIDIVRVTHSGNEPSHQQPLNKLQQLRTLFTQESQELKSNFNFESTLFLSPNDPIKNWSTNEINDILQVTKTEATISYHRILAANNLFDKSDTREHTPLQNLDLLRFLKEHQPLKPEKLREDRTILENKKFLQYYFSIHECLESCELFQYRDYLSRAFYFFEPNNIHTWEILENLKVMKQIEPSNELKKLIKDFKNDLEVKIQSLWNSVNENSFFGIKLKLEQLYNFCEPTAINPAFFKSIFNKHTLNIKAAIIEFLKREDVEIDQFDEAKIDQDETEITDYRFSEWIKLKEIFFSGMRKIQSKLYKKFRYSFTDPLTLEFLNNLLFHPLSILVSKKGMDLNWTLISRLVSLYEKMGQKHELQFNNPENINFLSLALGVREKQKNIRLFPPLSNNHFCSSTIKTIWETLKNDAKEVKMKNKDSEIFLQFTSTLTEPTFVKEWNLCEVGVKQVEEQKNQIKDPKLPVHQSFFDHNLLETIVKIKNNVFTRPEIFVFSNQEKDDDAEKITVLVNALNVSYTSFQICSSQSILS